MPKSLGRCSNATRSDRPRGRAFGHIAARTPAFACYSCKQIRFRAMLQLP
jgi:hypothetical protein